VRRRVEGEVVVDELAEVGVGGVDALVLLGIGLGLRRRMGLLLGGHLLRKLLEVRHLELRPRDAGEQAGEAALHDLRERNLAHLLADPVPPFTVAHLRHVLLLSLRLGISWIWL
jgi:hypothetical protein